MATATAPGVTAPSNPAPPNRNLIAVVAVATAASTSRHGHPAPSGIATSTPAVTAIPRNQFRTGRRIPFAVVLVGQPTLRQRLRLGVLAALDQRIAVRYQIGGMSIADTADYIRHHCKIAGRSDTLFSDDAIALIHNAYRGHPRAVNNLALHALTAAFAADHAIVDEKAARIAISRNRRGLNPIRVASTTIPSSRRGARDNAHDGPAHHTERGRSHPPDPRQPR